MSKESQRSKTKNRWAITISLWMVVSILRTLGSLWSMFRMRGLSPALKTHHQIIIFFKKALPHLTYSNHKRALCPRCWAWLKAKNLIIPPRLITRSILVKWKGKWISKIPQGLKTPRTPQQVYSKNLKRKAIYQELPRIFRLYLKSKLTITHRLRAPQKSICEKVLII